jgi:ribose transport system substrate-binding protein
MTNTSQSPDGSSPAGSSGARKGVNWSFIFLMIIAAALVLYFAGAFRRAPRVAMVAGDSPYWDLVVAGAQEAADQYDVKLTVLRSKPDVTAQSDAINELLRHKFDGIAVSPINPIQQAGLLSKVASDTSLVTFDSDSALSGRVCFVGTDNYAAGRFCGQMVRQACPDGGEVVITISNLDKENGQRRRQGVIDELLERNFEPEFPMDAADATLKGEKFTVVATLIDNGDSNLATQQASEAIKKYPNLKCFAGLNSYSTPAVLKSLDDAKKTGQIKVVAFDVAPETLAGIESGSVEVAIMQDQFGCGFHTVRILAECARGNQSDLPVFRRRTLPIEIVNKENVANVRAQLTHPKGSS